MFLFLLAVRSGKLNTWPLLRNPALHSDTHLSKGLSDLCALGQVWAKWLCGDNERLTYPAEFLSPGWREGKEISLQVCTDVSLGNWNVPKPFLAGELNTSYQQAKKKKIVWSSFPRQWVLNRDLTWNDWHINLSGLLHEVHIWSNRQQWVFKHHNGPSCQRVFYRFTESSDTWLLCKHEGKKKFSENFAQINENLVSYVC